MVIRVLINVAFITLIERKILGYTQNRLGPNKPSLIGLFQPIRDAIKLFSKNYVLGINIHKLIFYLGPGFALFLVLILWFLNPYFTLRVNYEFGLIVLLIILALNVYPVILSGWSSIRKYRLLGRIRRVAQSISYEISLAFILIIFILFFSSLRLRKIILRKIFIFPVFLIPNLILIWILSALAERNRTPFDFSEGESELVSGFNTEYGRGGFAVIFIAEYGRIYFLSRITVYVIFGFFSLIFYSFFTRVLVFFWVWVRSTYPRYRYDILINLAWKRLLPLVLIFLILVMIFSYYIKI